MTEAVQRIISSFAAEERLAIQAQLADCLQAVVAQRLRFDAGFGIRLPECEILRSTNAVRNLIRQGHAYKLPSAIETGSPDGMWSFDRYRAWMEDQHHWFMKDSADAKEAPDSEPGIENPVDPASLPELSPSSPPAEPVRDSAGEEASASESSDVFVIRPPEEGSLKDIISEFEDPR